MASIHTNISIKWIYPLSRHCSAWLQQQWPQKRREPRLFRNLCRASSALLCMLFIKTLNLHNFVKSCAAQATAKRAKKGKTTTKTTTAMKTKTSRSKRNGGSNPRRYLIPPALNKWQKCNCNKIWRAFSVTFFFYFVFFITTAFSCPFSFIVLTALLCVCCNLIFLLHLALWNFAANRALCIFRPFLTAVGSNWQSIFHSSGHSHSSSSSCSSNGKCIFTVNQSNALNNWDAKVLAGFTQNAKGPNPKAASTQSKSVSG